jgi:hypothetical protein
MNEKTPRRYPEQYERFIPLALGIITALIVVLLVVAFLVIFGVFPS